jgi:hypothetical protein
MVIKKLKPTGLKTKIKTKNLTLSLVKNIMAEFLQLKVFINDAIKNEIANLQNQILNQKEKLELADQINQLRNSFIISKLEITKMEKTLDLAFKEKAIALEDLRSLTESVNSAKEGKNEIPIT